MKTIAYLSAAIIVISTSLASAESVEDSQASCFESAGLEYMQHTEILMHVYERAELSPRDFEKLRANLIIKRDNQVSICNDNVMVDQHESVDQQRSVASTRAPASVSIIKPVPLSHIAPTQAQDKPLRRGAYTEVLSEDTDQYCSSDTCEDTAYNGERVSVGN